VTKLDSGKKTELDIEYMKELEIGSDVMIDKL